LDLFIDNCIRKGSGSITASGYPLHVTTYTSPSNRMDWKSTV